MVQIKFKNILNLVVIENIENKIENLIINNCNKH